MSFRSASDQDPKAAKFAVLTPGHAGFPKRVKCSEGSNSAPIQNAPVSACKPLCAILLAKASVYPLSPAKANVDRFAGHCDKNFFAAWYPLMEVGKGGVTAFENPLKSV